MQMNSVKMPKDPVLASIVQNLESVNASLLRLDREGLVDFRSNPEDQEIESLLSTLDDSSTNARSCDCYALKAEVVELREEVAMLRSAMKSIAELAKSV
jgi:hypothetical protein